MNFTFENIWWYILRSFTPVDFHAIFSSCPHVFSKIWFISYSHIRLSFQSEFPAIKIDELYLSKLVYNCSLFVRKWLSLQICRDIKGKNICNVNNYIKIIQLRKGLYSLFWCCCFFYFTQNHLISFWYYKIL